MPWKQRGNILYYYRSRRVGSRVVSEYVGPGVIGQLAEMMDIAKRQDDERERLAGLAIRREMDTIATAGIEAEETIKLLVKAWLLVNGWHTHKREWRRKRERRT